MAAKFEVRDNRDPGRMPGEEVAVEHRPRLGPFSSVWVMSTDDARELYVTLGTYLEDE